MQIYAAVHKKAYQAWHINTILLVAPPHGKILVDWVQLVGGVTLRNGLANDISYVSCW